MHGNPYKSSRVKAPPAPGRDVRDVLDGVRRLVRALRLSSREAERTVGLSGAQLFVLKTLAGHASLSPGELAHLTSTDQSSVSVVAKRLVERGLVARARDPRDRRRFSLALSDRGRRLVRSAPDPVQGPLVAAVSALTAAERRSLARLLAELVRGMGFRDSRAPMFFQDEEGTPSAPSRARVRKR